LPGRAVAGRGRLLGGRVRDHPGRPGRQRPAPAVLRPRRLRLSEWPPRSRDWPVKSSAARCAACDVSPCSARRRAGPPGSKAQSRSSETERGEAMSAKQKLNAAHCSGALLVAGLLGWVTGSLLVFLIALIALLVAGYHAGDIRR